ncbi:hypothetical protein CFP71_27935 [Amycolatopsis thailandensis]|uniref:Uncharacterized protein n=1 Tax=Amycolatopsis thailandensis TaxID=589330 RepID=A0A229RUA2_9PSEU|nr:hypothetical protein [Amycolatopsis thailandensis]OXM50267.1 hypothetical protein CFP71_27935 [Amycolatopsis thailandensis]
MGKGRRRRDKTRARLGAAAVKTAPEPLVSHYFQQFPIMVLHRALLDRGWIWGLPRGEFPPPGFRPQDEWTRYIPDECVWRYPGSVEGPDELDHAAIQWISEAEVSWFAFEDPGAEISVHTAYVDCCAYHERHTYSGTVYPVTRDGVRSLLADLHRVEQHLLRPAMFEDCPGAHVASRPAGVPAATPAPARPGSGAGADIRVRRAPEALMHPDVVGIPNSDWQNLLMDLAEARRSAVAERGRDGRGPKPKMSLADTVVAAVLSARFGTYTAAIAELYGVSYVTVTRALAAARPWLDAAAPRTVFASAGFELRTAAALRAYFGLDSPIGTTPAAILTGELALAADATTPATPRREPAREDRKASARL